MIDELAGAAETVTARADDAIVVQRLQVLVRAHETPQGACPAFRQHLDPLHVYATDLQLLQTNDTQSFCSHCACMRGALQTNLHIAGLAPQALAALHRHEQLHQVAVNAEAILISMPAEGRTWEGPGGDTEARDAECR